MYDEKLYNKVNEAAKEFKGDCIKFIQKLLQTPSISGYEFQLTKILIAEMEKLGYDDVSRDKYGNVIGIIKGDEEGPTIMYNSHMDHVAPGDISNWEGYDPYGGQIDVCQCDNQDRTGKELVECIHGRGASDVKSGHGFQIYAGAILLRLRQQGVKLKGDFMYTGVVHEESGQNGGTRQMLTETFPERGLDFDAMVSSEATSLNLYLGHRGRIEYLITVYGRTSHGSCPQNGINAIYKAIPVIEKIKNEVIPKLPKDPDNEVEPASISLNIIECSPGALSIVPDQCFLSFDRRTMIGETEESAMQILKNVLDDIAAEDPEFKADVQVKPCNDTCYTGEVMEGYKFTEAWKIKKDHPFTQACARAIENIGQPVKYGYWSFATDAAVTAGHYRKPTIGYSAMQEQFAHTPYDKCRTDFIEKAMAGNAAIFLTASEMKKEEFKALDF